MFYISEEEVAIRRFPLLNLQSPFSLDNVVGVVPFILWCFITALRIENVQHLWR